MSKYTLITAKKIIGYDDETHKVIVYEPKEVSPSSLKDGELEALLECVAQNPGGGTVTRTNV